MKTPRNMKEAKAAIETTALDVTCLCSAISEILQPSTTVTLEMSETGRTGLAILFDIIREKSGAIFEALESMEADHE